MNRTTENTSPLARKRPRGRKRGWGRFGDYRADAVSLGVSSIHLWHCLSGRRSSPELLADYQLLKASQAASAAALSASPAGASSAPVPAVNNP
jgi:hypothetical protein